MKILFFIFFIFNSIYSTTTKAGTPLWSFQPRTTTSVTVTSSQTAVVSYTVTNNMNKIVNLTMQTITGVTQLATDPSNTIPSGQVCQSATAIAARGNCILFLRVNGSQLTQSFIGGPVMCRNGNAIQCYKPSTDNLLNVTLASSPTISSGCDALNSRTDTLDDDTTSINITGTYNAGEEVIVTANYAGTNGIGTPYRFTAVWSNGSTNTTIINASDSDITSSAVAAPTGVTSLNISCAADCHIDWDVSYSCQ